MLILSDLLTYFFLFVSDLAALRKLLEEVGGTCPSCNMPFDKGKKRKLIDTCGHERCYSCMFRNEICPLCSSSDGKLAKEIILLRITIRDLMHFPGIFFYFNNAEVSQAMMGFRFGFSRIKC